jgi:hypothetical protein
LPVCQYLLPVYHAVLTLFLLVFPYLPCFSLSSRTYPVFLCQCLPCFSLSASTYCLSTSAYPVFPCLAVPTLFFPVFASAYPVFPVCQYLPCFFFPVYQYFQCFHCRFSLSSRTYPVSVSTYPVFPCLPAHTLFFPV